MATRHASFRLDEGTYRRLDRRSRESGQSRSRLAGALIEEGLRMEEHPGIVFRSGPMGRRGGLARGPDVWQVVELVEELRGAGAQALSRAIDETALSEEQVRAALRYYAAYPEEVDEMIARNREEAEQAEAAWRRERELLS